MRNLKGKLSFNAIALVFGSLLLERFDGIFSSYFWHRPKSKQNPDSYREGNSNCSAGFAGQPPLRISKEKGYKITKCVFHYDGSLVHVHYIGMHDLNWLLHDLNWLPHGLNQRLHDLNQRLHDLNWLPHGLNQRLHDLNQRLHDLNWLPHDLN